MNQVRIAIAGASGRMGRMLVETTLKSSGLVLVAAFEQPGSPFIGKDAGELAGQPCGVAITSDVAAGLAKADCLMELGDHEEANEYFLKSLAVRKVFQFSACAAVVGR